MTELPPSVLAELSDGVVTLDAELRVTAANDAAAGVLGTTAAQLTAAPLWTVVPGVSERELRANAPESAGEIAVIDGGSPITVRLAPAERGYVALLSETTGGTGAGSPADGSPDDNTEREPVGTQLADLLAAIDAALTGGQTRIEVERALCGALGASELYRLAWVAGYTPGWEQLEPRARAGPAADFMGLHDLALDEDGRLAPLLGRVIDTGEPAVIDDIGTAPTAAAWRDRAADHGLAALALVPVVHRSVVSGVVACYTDRTDAFGRRERRLLAAVGSRLGRTAHTLELERLIHGETVVELTFDSTDDASFLVTSSRALECDIDVLASLPSGEESMLYYVAVDGCPPAEYEQYCRDRDAIDTVRLVEGSDDGSVFELVTDRRTLASTLVANDAVVTGNRALAGRAEVVCEVAGGKDLNDLLGRVTEQFPAAELRSKRQRDRATERATRAARGAERAFETQLTERQRQCLRAAVYGGYFASPRKSTGQEIAAALSMTQPTFSYHLRKAQQRLFENLLRTDVADGHAPPGFHP